MKLKILLNSTEQQNTRIRPDVNLKENSAKPQNTTKIKRTLFNEHTHTQTHTHTHTHTHTLSLSLSLSLSMYLSIYLSLSEISARKFAILYSFYLFFSFSYIKFNFLKLSRLYYPFESVSELENC